METQHAGKGYSVEASESHSQNEIPEHAEGDEGAESVDRVKAADDGEGLKTGDFIGAADGTGALEETAGTTDGVEASAHPVAGDPFLTTEWAINAARYEWNDEYGDLGPKIPELEAMLFGEAENAGQVGQHINS